MFPDNHFQQPWDLGQKFIYLKWKPFHLAILLSMITCCWLIKILNHLGKAGMQWNWTRKFHPWGGHYSILLFFPHFIQSMTLGIRPQSQKKWNVADSALLAKKLHLRTEEGAMYSFILRPPSRNRQSYGWEYICKWLDVNLIQNAWLKNFIVFQDISTKKSLRNSGTIVRGE